MNDSYAPSVPQTESAGTEPREGRRDELVLRLDWNTGVIAAAAFAVGVLVGFLLD